jgi:hypothetical protein
MTYDCPKCEGTGVITVNGTSAPQNGRMVRCRLCLGSGKLLCEMCSKEATVAAWVKEECDSGRAELAYYCAACFSAGIATDEIVAIEPSQEPNETATSRIFNFKTCDVFGTCLNGLASVEIARIGGFDRWDPAQALEIAAALVSAATFAAAKAKREKP